MYKSFAQPCFYIAANVRLRGIPNALVVPHSTSLSETTLPL